MADKEKRPALYASWLSPRQALGSLTMMDRHAGIFAIHDALSYGHLSAMARRYHLKNRGKPSDGEYLMVPADVWPSARAGFESNSLWNTGSTTLDVTDDSAPNYLQGTFELYLVGVRFDPSGIDQMIEDAGGARVQPATIKASSPVVSPVTEKAESPSPPNNKGGRPPKPFWDDLLIEMFRRIHYGELTPVRQADIQRAMEDWLSEQGYDAGDATLKRAARKLFAALRD